VSRAYLCLFNTVFGRLTLDMQPLEENVAPGRFAFPKSNVVRKGPASSGATETNLCEIRINRLRQAIHKNQVSFPSQVPTFPKHDRSDLQRKLVQLYFVLGWSPQRIGERYGISRSRAQQILNVWRRRAVETGYVQSIPPAERIHASRWIMP
jgi:hypothetical protein